MNLFPHQNPLPKPDVLNIAYFEDLLIRVKKRVVEHLRETAPEDADAVEETLNNNAEILTKITEALIFIFQGFLRQENEKALQMFGMYATDTKMVDLICSQLNVKRQIIEKGDPNAYPPVEPVMESNESLLTRYYLAAYALASTGTRSGYRFHAMTLGGRPSVDVQSPEPNKIVVTYEFADHEFSGQTKDAQARQTSPGKVEVIILSHKEDGSASVELIDATQTYLERDDIGRETDDITVKTATIRRWNCEATLYIKPGLSSDDATKLAVQAAHAYGALQHRLMGHVEPSRLETDLVVSVNAHRCELAPSVQPIRCTYQEAPYLERIQITIITENI
jgi:phage-related baseplate assembly protein